MAAAREKGDVSFEVRAETLSGALAWGTGEGSFKHMIKKWRIAVTLCVCVNLFWLPRYVDSELLSNYIYILYIYCIFMVILLMYHSSCFLDGCVSQNLCCSFPASFYRVSTEEPQNRWPPRSRCSRNSQFGGCEKHFSFCREVQVDPHVLFGCPEKFEEDLYS